MKSKKFNKIKGLIVPVLACSMLLSTATTVLAVEKVTTVNSKTCTKIVYTPKTFWFYKVIFSKRPAPQPAPVPTPSPAPVQGLSVDEQKMVDLVNAERTAQGLKPLQVDLRLVKVARMKSQDMINKNYFDHNSPTYGSPFDMMRNNGITYKFAGENLAGNSTVANAHTSLMNSPGHRANILNTNYTHIGIGIIDGGPYGKMFTQEFIG